MNADSIKIECEEDGFWLVIEHDEHSITSIPGKSRARIVDPEALYDTVKREIGPWLYERDMAKSVGAFGSGGYELDDPKHPDFHSIHADIWDSREGK